MNQVKVALVVGEKKWLDSITSLIDHYQELLIAWSATSLKEALRLVNSKAVDIIVVDSNLTEGRYDGLELTRIIVADQRIKAKVIMISELHHEDLISRAFLYGAVNYIFKEDIDELPAVIRNVVKKKPAYEVLIKYYQHTHQDLLLSRLTPSEKEVYLFKVQGRSIRQIALATHKAEGTVKNQLSRAGKKLRTVIQFMD